MGQSSWCPSTAGSGVAKPSGAGVSGRSSSSTYPASAAQYAARLPDVKSCRPAANETVPSSYEKHPPRFERDRAAVGHQNPLRQADVAVDPRREVVRMSPVGVVGEGHPVRRVGPPQLDVGERVIEVCVLVIEELHVGGEGRVARDRESTGLGVDLGERSAEVRERRRSGMRARGGGHSERRRTRKRYGCRRQAARQGSTGVRR
jgi:hypothetical protein